MSPPDDDKGLGFVCDLFFRGLFGIIATEDPEFEPELEDLDIPECVLLLANVVRLFKELSR